MTDTPPPVSPAPANTERFDRFTERAKKVMALARSEGQRLQHNYLGTEHLLLGLVAVEDGIAAKVLKGRGVELNKVRSGVEFIVGRGDRQVSGDVSLTPRTKKVIELAVDEARQFNHNYIGTEHLLLGLIREGEGIAAGVLESVGVNLEDTRKQIVDVVSQSQQPPVERIKARLASLPAVSDVTGSKDSVITCRIPAGDLEALDALIEAGIRTTRSDAAAWLIHAGIQANLDLFDKVYTTVAEIKRLRDQAQSAARDLESKAKPEAPPEAPPSSKETA
jgi:ATP-dependent Clp protease ATP-binding subunit ClpA